MLTGYQILFLAALLWETVYTCSYGCAVFQGGKRTGGLAIALLSVLPLAVFAFLIYFQGE